jgi:hypothetical protein
VLVSSTPELAWKGSQEELMTPSDSTHGETYALSKANKEDPKDWILRFRAYRDVSIGLRVRMGRLQLFLVWVIYTNGLNYIYPARKSLSLFLKLLVGSIQFSMPTEMKYEHLTGRWILAVVLFSPSSTD